jgi:hypothetical protein
MLSVSANAEEAGWFLLAAAVLAKRNPIRMNRKSANLENKDLPAK